MSQFGKKLRAILEKAGKLEGGVGDTLLAEAQSSKRPFTEVLVKKGVATEHTDVTASAQAQTTETAICKFGLRCI